MDERLAHLMFQAGGGGVPNYVVQIWLKIFLYHIRT